MCVVKNKGQSKGATGGARPKEYSDKKCGECGLIHEKRKYPAYGKLYHKCSKPHLFAKFCKSKLKENVHNLDESYYNNSNNFISSG